MRTKFQYAAMEALKFILSGRIASNNGTGINSDINKRVKEADLRWLLVIGYNHKHGDIISSNFKDNLAEIMSTKCWDVLFHLSFLGAKHRSDYDIDKAKMAKFYELDQKIYNITILEAIIEKGEAFYED